MEPIALDRLTDLDTVLTDDEILARNTVRQFVADKYLQSFSNRVATAVAVGRSIGN